MKIILSFKCMAEESVLIYTASGKLAAFLASNILRLDMKIFVSLGLCLNHREAKPTVYFYCQEKQAILLLYYTAMAPNLLGATYPCYTVLQKGYSIVE